MVGARGHRGRQSSHCLVLILVRVDEVYSLRKAAPHAGKTPLRPSVWFTGVGTPNPRRVIGLRRVFRAIETACSERFSSRTRLIDATGSTHSRRTSSTRRINRAMAVHAALADAGISYYSRRES